MAELQRQALVDGHDDDRRLVTVLFVDVAGFTGMAEQDEAENVRDLLNDLFEQIVPIVERSGGSVDKFIGDCLMAVFGAPVAHEDDARRAVSVALALRPALARFNEVHSLQLAVHTGINTGFVVAGKLGAGTRPGYSVIGDAVNVASRLCAASLPGEILIGADTRKLLGEEFELQDGGAAAVRGRAREVAFYRVLGARPVRARLPRDRFSSRFVGRESELSLISSTLGELVTGQRGTVLEDAASESAALGGTALIQGEAGVGKTRLLTEVRVAAEAAGLHWVEGRVPSFGLDPAYSIARSLLESDLGLEPEDDGKTRQDKVRAHLGDLPFQDRGQQAWLEQALLLDADGNVSPQAFAGEEGPGLSARLCAYFARAARTRPLSVCVDDVHWLDKASLDLLRDMVALAAEYPIFFLLVGRPDPPHVWQDLRLAAAAAAPGRLLEITLMPLSRAETRELLANLVRMEEIPISLEQLVQSKAEGNPFFAMEILRHLAQVGALVEDDGKFRLARTIAHLQIPDTVRGLIASRIDGLEEEPRRCLQEAAVIGRNFSPRLLCAAMALQQEQLAPVLGELAALELVRVRRREPEVEYGFQHALTQEAAYDGLLTKTKKQIHGRVAEAALRVFPPETPGLAALLAYHFSRSENWEEAREWSLRAAECAVAMAADQDACSYCELALASLLTAFDQEWEAMLGDSVEWFFQRLEPFRQLRTLDRLLGPAVAFQEKMARARGADDPRTLAAQGLVAACHLSRGAYPEAIQMLEQTLAAWHPAVGDSRPSEARLLFLLGIGYRNQDRFVEAEAALRRALALARSGTTSLASLIPPLYLYLSAVLSCSGQLAENLQLIEEALAKPEVKESGEYWELTSHLVDTFYTLGEWDRAVALGESAAGKIANPFVRAMFFINLAGPLSGMGRTAEAERCLSEAVARFEEQGKPRELAYALQESAENQLKRGEVGEAEQSAQRSLALLTQIGWAEHSERARTLFTLAGIALARRDLPAAAECLEESSSLAEGKFEGLHPFRAELLFRRGQVSLLQGRTAEALRERREAMEIYEKMSGPAHPRIRQMEEEWEKLAPPTGARPDRGGDS
jgi:class 3 adenylate cyclase/tetratricopeptide (TPR) repeat protein